MDDHFYFAEATRLHLDLYDNYANKYGMTTDVSRRARNRKRRLPILTVAY